MRFLFWNVKKNPVGPILSEIVRQHDVKVIILAECRDKAAILVDLNMNAFEMGVIQADGLHGVMTQAIARKRHRPIGDEVYPYFYNPMWGRFGDTTKGPPGTYYATTSSRDEYFWHTFDQVLIRPDLLDSFDEAELQVLTDCGGIEFLRESGIPDDSRASDHLPLLF